jgi:hypothetical protein
MPRPTHENTFTARRVFTDREGPIDLFLSALEAGQPHVYAEHGEDVYRVLMFYGVGGQGKTALFRHLNEHLSELSKHRKEARTQVLAYSSVNFEEGQGKYLNPAETLLKIRLELKQRGGFACPHFDVAFTRYFALSRRGASIREAHPELFRGENEFVNDLLEKAGDVVTDISVNDIVEIAGDALKEMPGLGFLIKYANRLRIKGQEWWERRDVKLLDGLDSKNQTELLQALPTFLGADLTRAQRKNTQLRLAVLVDTYEYLWRDTAQRGMNYLIDDWVRQLVQDSPGVFFAFFGRDKLTWADKDTAWDTILKHHLLEGLRDDDADSFLREAGVQEAELRKVIVSSSKGSTPDEGNACLPFYLDLQLSQYEKDRNDGKEIRASKYGGSHSEILERFLKPPYTDRQAKNALFVMAQARYLTRELYAALAARFLDATALSFNEMLSYSFVESQGDQLTFHALMRDYLQAQFLKTDPGGLKSVHNWLFDYHDGKAQPEAINRVLPKHEQALLEAAYYKERVDPKGFPQWCLDRTEIFYKAGRFVLATEMLLKALKIAEETLGERDSTTLTVENFLAINFRGSGKFAKARELLEQALPISKEVRGTEDNGTIMLMNNLALIYYDLGDYRPSFTLNRKVLKIRKRLQNDEDPDILMTCNNIALSLERLKRYAKARDLSKNLLAACQRVLGEKDFRTLTVMNNLASNHYELREYAAARNLGERVVVLKTQELGSEHPSTLTSKNDLALTLAALREHEEARKLNLQVLEVRKRTLGDEHPHTLTSKHNLAVNLRALGEHDEARRLNEEVLAARTRVLGEEHPDTIVSRGNLTLNPRALDERDSNR